MAAYQLAGPVWIYPGDVHVRSVSMGEVCCEKVMYEWDGATFACVYEFAADWHGEAWVLIHSSPG